MFAQFIFLAFLDHANLCSMKQSSIFFANLRLRGINLPYSFIFLLRDLSKPIAVQHESKREKYMQTYNVSCFTVASSEVNRSLQQKARLNNNF